MNNERCIIWGTPSHRSFNSNNPRLDIMDSRRVRGRYSFHLDTEYSIKELSEPAKARLTSWLIKQRVTENDAPEITRKVVQFVKNSQSMSVSERLDQILLFLDMETKRPGSRIEFNPNPENQPYWDQATTRYYELLIRSESANWEDLRFLFDHLTERNLIRNAESSDHKLSYLIEIPGFQHIEEIKKFAPTTNKVFVAMWFGEELRPIYSEGFEPAIKKAGYQAVRVDLEHFSEKIDDKIISEIRRARFIVADFSKGGDGARGSVYYEAGFAHGLGREVIFTCRNTDINHVGFDTRQYPHIVWKDADDLQMQLYDRIIARIGDGPHRDQ